MLRNHIVLCIERRTAAEFRSNALSSMLALTYAAMPQICASGDFVSHRLGDADPASKNRFYSLRLDSHHRIRLD